MNTLYYLLYILILYTIYVILYIILYIFSIYYRVSTTRNVTSTLFNDWFCGGLQYQVDHHLFPSLPRHNLHKVNALVKIFCKEHGVSYHEAGMY